MQDMQEEKAQQPGTNWDPGGQQEVKTQILSTKYNNHTHLYTTNEYMM